MSARYPFVEVLVGRAQRDPDFRARLLADPRAVVAEAAGVEFPASVEVRVVEEQPGEVVLVLPPVGPPPNEIRDAELTNVAGGTTITCTQTLQTHGCRPFLCD